MVQTLTSPPQVTPQIAAEKAENAEIRPLADMDQFVDDEEAEFRPIPIEKPRVDKDPATHGHRLYPGAPEPHHQRSCGSQPHLLRLYRVDENPQLVSIHTCFREDAPCVHPMTMLTRFGWRTTTLRTS